jgi:hypothetical protein
VKRTIKSQLHFSFDFGFGFAHKCINHDK